MNSIVTKLNRPSPKRHTPEFAPSVSFGNASLKRGVQNAGQDSVEKFSQWVMENPRLDKLGKINLKVWNLSLQDWSARIATASAFYVPQTVLAFMEEKHKWETLGRNVLNWTVTIGILILSKHEKYGLNALFNPYLKPQEELPKTASRLKEWVNQRRFKPEFFEFISDELKINLQKWTTLDENHFDDLKVVWKKLDARQKAQEGLTQAEKYIYKAIPEVTNRISAYKFISVGISVTALAFFVGKGVMDFVYRFIAPFDDDFDALKYAKMKDQLKTPQAPDVFSVRLPSRLTRIPSASEFIQPRPVFHSNNFDFPQNNKLRVDSHLLSPPLSEHRRSWQ